MGTIKVLLIVVISWYHRVEAAVSVDVDEHGNTWSYGPPDNELRFTPGGNCTAGQFNCGYKCIPQSWIQDGEYDCSPFDDADEDKSFPRPGPLPCGEGILEGDTWEELGCRHECKNGFIDSSDKRCGPVKHAYCEEDLQWNGKNFTSNCICRKGGRCVKDRPTSCLDGEIWVTVGGCTANCYDGQWNPITCGYVHGPPRRLAPIIPPELNYCKVHRNGQIVFGEYNARCNTCENCEVPECELACHRFNTRTCGCRRNPFCKNKC